MTGDPGHDGVGLRWQALRWRGLPGTAALIVLLAIAAVSQGPTLAAPDGAPPAAATSGPPPAPAPSSPLWTAYDAVAGLLSGTAERLSNLASATREALYETAYMFGANATPVPRSPISDPVFDLVPAPNDLVPASPLSRPAAAAVPGAAGEPVRATPVPPPAEPRLIPSSAAATTVEPRATKPPDPGLIANFVYDQSMRRPDGSYFVPKPLQRLFDVRTQRAVIRAVPLTVKLPGRIVPDPHAHGQVESSLLGRIVAPPGGLPTIGETVRAGQILGYVEPAVGVVDRTQVRREVAQLTTQIRVETENLEILKQFFFVPFRDGKIYQAEQRIAGLRRERDALLPLLQTQEPLRAPTDGVISSSAAVPGLIVHPGDRIFDIVNPKLLWVEASAPDPGTAETASRVVRATALTPEGQLLALSFVGSSLSVRQQSTPVLFRIDDPPPGLRVGRPVTVSVESESRTERGFPIRRDAITVASDGVQQAWEQVEPEVFLPRPVRVRDLDGQTLLVIDGIPDGARIVVAGVALLGQLE